MKVCSFKSSYCVITKINQVNKKKSYVKNETVYFWLWVELL